MTRIARLVIGIAFSMGLPAAPVLAAETLNVSLWDKMNAPMATNLGMGMSGDMSTAAMGITIDRSTVKAGEVTFQVKNDSTMSMPHEMVVAPTASPDTALPYSEANSEVDEGTAGALGEVEEINAGTSGSVTLTLTPGTYVLFCNLPGHYAAGMWTLLTVEP